jgi:hypothetical protein
MKCSTMASLSIVKATLTMHDSGEAMNVREVRCGSLAAATAHSSRTWRGLEKCLNVMDCV